MAARMRIPARGITQQAQAAAAQKETEKDCNIMGQKCYYLNSKKHQIAIIIYHAQEGIRQ